MSQDYDAYSGTNALPILNVNEETHDQKLKNPEAIEAIATRSHLEPSPSAFSPSSILDAATPLYCNTSRDAQDPGPVSGSCVTKIPSNPSSIPADALTEADSHNTVAPLNSIVRPGTRDSSSIQLPPSTKTSTTISKGELQSATAGQDTQTSNSAFPALHETLDHPANLVGKAHGDKMLFGNHSSAQAGQRRRNYANTNAVTDYEADLTSKDRSKQKEAVKRFLMEMVKQDWTWEWPRPEQTSSEASPLPSLKEDSKEDAKEDSANINQDGWKERDEWMSNTSDDGEPTGLPHSISSGDTPSTKNSPYRFESPDGIEDTIKKTASERKRRRKKRLAEELAWNDGLKCFTSRRDAWTGARKVSRPSLGLAPVKTGQRSSTSSGDGGSSTVIEHEEDDEWEDDIEIPIVAPIIPVENAMRASITPTAYNTIYDKVVLQALTPSCPMNLKDVTRSCVQGWKRDGEWPPKSSVPDIPKKKGRKMSVASLFGIEKKEEPKENDVEKDKGEKKPSTGSGIRKGLQKILSLGHSSSKDTAQNGNGSGKSKDGASH